MPRARALLVLRVVAPFFPFGYMLAMTWGWARLPEGIRQEATPVLAIVYGLLGPPALGLLVLLWRTRRETARW